MIIFLKVILYPISLLYGVIISIRNKFFDWGIFPSKEFALPVISVGNLSVGGTGKTPHIEYLIRLLTNQSYKVAYLSRGYKRKTKGFILADENSTAYSIGDEAYQVSNKYPNIIIAVDKNRVKGIERLIHDFPDIDVILLDDAFQHRWVKPGLNILTTCFYHPFHKDHMLPSGRLREFKSGAKRADILIVTRSPVVLSPIVRKEFIEKTKFHQKQEIFFSKVRHLKIKPFPGFDIKTNIDRVKSIIVFTGIADPYLLERYLRKYCDYLDVIEFADHYDYTIKDIEMIKERYTKHFSQNKILVTTEKDISRLLKKEIVASIKDLPLYYVPIEVEFHEKESKNFDNEILNYVRKNSRNS